jgi:hypothetical protein|tara:strand:+ start:216 stop:434 length:219 start_codon:yes stop_codon:yes gene_type:complete
MKKDFTIKSWSDLNRHPDIIKIEDLRKEFKNSGQNEIIIHINQFVTNPVTGELGGAFYAADLKDAKDLMGLK